MRGKILKCLHMVHAGYQYNLCPKCIEKAIAKAMKEEEAK
jgi:hypothetical protein